MILDIINSYFFAWVCLHKYWCYFYMLVFDKIAILSFTFENLIHFCYSYHLLLSVFILMLKCQLKNWFCLRDNLFLKHCITNSFLFWEMSFIHLWYLNSQYEWFRAFDGAPEFSKYVLEAFYYLLIQFLIL